MQLTGYGENFIMLYVKVYDFDKKPKIWEEYINEMSILWYGKYQGH